MKFWKKIELPEEVNLVKIDGFANIFVSRYFITVLVWLFVFLASCASSVYLIVNSVLEYNE